LKTYCQADPLFGAAFGAPMIALVPLTAMAAPKPSLGDGALLSKLPAVA
jgi:hypothetical protein